MLARTFASSSTTGYRAGANRHGAAATGWCERLAFGGLNIWGSAGFACADLTVNIGGAYWNMAARACGTAGNRGEYKEV